MKKIETKVLFRCSGLGQINTNPVGKTNAQKYEDGLEALDKAKQKEQEAKDKSLEAKTKRDALEPEKENDVPARKNSKSPKEQYMAADAEFIKRLDNYREASEKVKDLESKLAELEKTKDIPTLSSTCRKYLKTMAIEIRYNRKKRMENRYTKKGLAVEDESIAIYSELKGEAFENNKVRDNDEFFTGEWDIEVQNKDGRIVKVDDIKSRYDLDTFEDNRDEDVKSKERDQLLGYMSILGCDRAAIVNVLTNNDFTLIQDQIKAETFKAKPSELNAIGDLNLARVIEIAKDNIFDEETFEEFIAYHLGEVVLGELKKGEAEEAAQEMFDGFVEVPLEERVIEVEVERDEEAIEALRRRVVDCRKWLAENYNIHHI